MFALVLIAVLMGGGCVETADCDQYVDCSEGEVCFQSRCLPECEVDEDCRDNERCARCEGDDQIEEPRCPSDDDRACVLDHDDADSR